MCRYACDLQPMLKVLAGRENVERLLHIDIPVSLDGDSHSSRRSMPSFRLT